MPAQILLTMDDLETAVPLNAALEAAGFATTMVSAMDDVRAVFRREEPDLLILTGAVHESPALAAGGAGARGRDLHPRAARADRLRARRAGGAARRHRGA